MFTLNEIHKALNNEEFFLEYMPTMSLPDEHCVGAEALIRWQRDDKVISPAGFIPLIENTPLSGLITYWVMDTVSRDLRSWLLKQDEVRISINVPPEIIGRGGIRYAAKVSGLSDVAEKMMFEVTERGLLDSLGVAAINMAEDYDVLFALDDLTMNDANLFILSRVDTSIVKLDKSFADGMLKADWTDKKIAAISALIKSGNLRVIAEGVETYKQIEILANAGIQMVQGWYFSQSLRATDFINYHAQHQ
jgi:sensor c-di-GMP phosphodiesterase-like protein